MRAAASTVAISTSSVCAEGADAQRTSLPFVVFELVMASLCTFSYFIMRRLRRLSELRAQQRYDRLSRIEVGFGANTNASDRTVAL
ncbi:hypothetical protein DQ04_02961050 [Trypanosoma grayi]|uniref:hypothetical protein n=1 Tax=Trypanosoma grayi TaxID=71804 RepID=UPI0004F4774B|nr:hypothetical protein DQ04_02961050 [Trypanosoma grayi]KEG11118.1 hypothetical protein DQ04_02961050 [Trypanosoma grayi]